VTPLDPKGYSQQRDMLSDRLRWNAKYRRKDYPEPAPVSADPLRAAARRRVDFRNPSRTGAGRGERCRDYFLRENELLHNFLSLRVLHYHEDRDDGREPARRLAALVAMRKG
jgi:hypothetical protein